MKNLIHSLRRIHLSCAAVLPVALATVFVAMQEPNAPPSAARAQDSATKVNKAAKKKYSHANDFLIRGTVFNDKALSLPGVELRIRPAGQKKYRWETYSNSRGEFAVRVPQGSDYEMLVHAKGFSDQTRTIDAKNGGNEETVVFRLEPAVGGKK
jgi:Carboxypeptidase regulatory-like domain